MQSLGASPPMASAGLGLGLGEGGAGSGSPSSLQPPQGLASLSVGGGAGGAGVLGGGGGPPPPPSPEIQMTYANPLFSLSLSPKQQRILHKTIFRGKADHHQLQHQHQQEQQLHERNRRNSRSLERRKESLELAAKLNSTKEKGGSWTGSRASSASSSEARRLSLGGVGGGVGGGGSSSQGVPSLSLDSLHLAGDETQVKDEGGGGGGGSVAADGSVSGSAAVTTVASALGVSERSSSPVPRSPRVKSSLSLRRDRKEKEENNSNSNSSNSSNRPDLNGKATTSSDTPQLSQNGKTAAAAATALDQSEGGSPGKASLKRSVKASSSSSPSTERVDTEEERRKKRFLENLKLFKDVEITKSMQPPTAAVEEEWSKKRRGSEAGAGGEDRPTVIERSATVAGLIHGGSGKRRTSASRQHSSTDSGAGGKRAHHADANLAAVFVRSLSISSSPTASPGEGGGEGGNGSKIRRKPRSEVAQEMVEAERTYVRQLAMLTHVRFHLSHCLLSLKEETLYRTPITQVFSAYPSFHRSHLEFLNALAERVHAVSWDDASSSLGDLLSEKTGFLQNYGVFLASHERDLKLVEQLLHTSYAFSQLVHDLERRPDLEQYTVLELLRCPSKHLPKYSAFLKDLTEATSIHHPDYGPTRKAHLHIRTLLAAMGLTSSSDVLLTGTTTSS